MSDKSFRGVQGDLLASALAACSNFLASAACSLDSLRMVALTTSLALNLSNSVWARWTSTSFRSSSSRISVARVASMWAMFTSLLKVVLFWASFASACALSVSLSVLMPLLARSIYQIKTLTYLETWVSAWILASSRSCSPTFLASPMLPMAWALATSTRAWLIAPSCAFLDSEAK